MSRPTELPSSPTELPSSPDIDSRTPQDRQDQGLTATEKGEGIDTQRWQSRTLDAGLSSRPDNTLHMDAGCDAFGGCCLGVTWLRSWHEDDGGIAVDKRGWVE
eukprot:2290993-Rhodomonas_salina.1